MPGGLRHPPNKCPHTATNTHLPLVVPSKGNVMSEKSKWHRPPIIQIPSAVKLAFLCVSRCWVGCDNCPISARIRQLDPPWPQWPHLRALGHQRIRNQHQASNHSNPTGGWAALSGGVLAWWVPQSGAHCAYQPKQCPRGVLRPSSYAQLSRLRPTTRHSDQKDRSQPVCPSHGHEPRVPRRRRRS